MSKVVFGIFFSFTIPLETNLTSFIQSGMFPTTWERYVVRLFIIACTAHQHRPPRNNLSTSSNQLAKS
ncbi:hypothetical protein SERLADRAFT_385712 [Serpula lacrymans var. lacrymans S7.9]|uniref:Uncharacterized protein n=1 Tax=Serpula lacrymans var. lacrymans (strain S7.9) TaxID=578457 RepID=F8NR65_SERL9|nr:uncharacterized protein SERLADRAFT_385712 [Serpula lacrymans var. lacrymans S7.9]EGO26712.1 hypothetical protein SERLADRAFT_385712 [Serpula lacrymans var. lacrymans S7.9]